MSFNPTPRLRVPASRFKTPGQLTNRPSKQIYFLKKSSGSAEFNPLTEPGLTLWLDGNDATTITQSGGDISQWDDKSAEGNDVSQGTGTLQPTTQAAVQNGRAVVRFDGVDDYLQRTTFTGGTITQANTMYMVLDPDSAASAVQQYFDAGGASNRNTAFQSTGAYGMFAGTTITNGTRSTNFVLLTMIFDGASSQMWENGSSVLTGNTGTQGMNGITLGARNDGMNNGAIDIGELLIFNASHGAAKRSEIETWLNSRWSLF